MQQELDIPDGHMYISPLGKIRRFIRMWRNGRKDHFPVCCVFRFSLESAWRDGKMVPIKSIGAGKRGMVRRSDSYEFVPCNIFHHSSKAPDDV